MRHLKRPALLGLLLLACLLLSILIILLSIKMGWWKK